MDRLQYLIKERIADGMRYRWAMSFLDQILRNDHASYKITHYLKFEDFISLITILIDRTYVETAQMAKYHRRSIAIGHITYIEGKWNIECI